MFVKWSNELAKIPIDEHASAVVWIITDNHDIPHANVMMLILQAAWWAKVYQSTLRDY